MIRRLINKIRNNGFVAATLKVGSGQLISQVISIITVPILSRIYADTAYGDAAIITSTAAVVIDLTTFGLNSAVMKPEKMEDAKKVFTTAFLLNALITTALVSVCMILQRQQLFLFEISEGYSIALLLMWLYIITYTTNSLMLVYMNKQGKYNKLFFNPIISSGAQVLLAIPLGMLGVGYKGFLITYITSNAIANGHMMWKNNPFYRGYRFRHLLEVVKTYKDYILYQCPSNFISTFAIEYPTQYLGRCFTTQQLGGYSMCVRVMKYPIRLIAAPISTVYFRTATEYHREGKNLAAFTYKMISRIFLISVVPVAVFIMTSKPLFAFVLGESWREAGALASFLVIQYVMMFCSQTTSYCRVSLGKQKANLLVTSINLIISIGSCVAGYTLFHSMEGTVFCYSLGQCVYGIYNMAVNFYIMDKKYLWKYIGISTAYTGLMFAFLILSR